MPLCVYAYVFRTQQNLCQGNICLYVFMPLCCVFFNFRNAPLLEGDLRGGVRRGFSVSNLMGSYLTRRNI